jgi:hypothetical protein
MKQLAYALPIAALACSPALAQQDPEYRATTPTATTETSSAGGIQIPPYEPERGPRAGAWETTLGGSGVSLNEFDSNFIGVTGSLGYYVTDWMPIGIRQNLNLSFGEDLSDSYLGISRAFIDFQAPLGSFQPFIGAVVGAQYGKNIDEKLVYGPEAGFKYWVNESTFMFIQGEWLAVEGESFENGNVVYTTGFGLNF